MGNLIGNSLSILSRQVALKRSSSVHTDVSYILGFTCFFLSKKSLVIFCSLSLFCVLLVPGDIIIKLFGKISVHIYIYMEKAMVTLSSTLAWEIPWAEEPGRLQSMGSRRVGHD